jgi:N-acetylmuramoyl-L-alanine amidase
MKVLIRQGDRSAQVLDVQARLRALGFEVADEPARYGPSTARATRAFQQRRGIIVDGIVGPETWVHLVDASWRLGDRSLYLRHPLMRGDDVLVLQARLNALGFDAGKEDGFFGPDTDRAVRSFQREYGVAEDGIYGPASHAALTGLRAERPLTAAALREELWLQELRGPAGALVVVDPGHGGDDAGERAHNGVIEADVCWDLAQRLAAHLTGIGARVRFSRTENEEPDTSLRARRANDLDADLFVSIHLNSHEEEGAEGASTYFFNGSRAGERLADAIQNGLVEIGARDCRSHARSYQILRETRMPAVVVEPCFITNPDEAKRLDDPDYRGAIAEAIAIGIRRYYVER